MAHDWSYYDAILNEIEKYGLQWFPMLLAGSGYALPAWLYESTNNVGFKCLEHGIVHDTQSIFHPFQTEYASRFIAEFGKHYGHRQSLPGIRLGPSGDLIFCRGGCRCPAIPAPRPVSEARKFAIIRKPDSDFAKLAWFALRICSARQLIRKLALHTHFASVDLGPRPRSPPAR